MPGRCISAWSADVFYAQLRREFTLLLGSLEEVLHPLVFLFLSITLFALGTGGGPDALRDLAPAIIWVLVLLANLLGLDALFRRDYDDGTLEQLVLLAEPIKQIGVFTVPVHLHPEVSASVKVYVIQQ